MGQARIIPVKLGQCHCCWWSHPLYGSVASSHGFDNEGLSGSLISMMDFNVVPFQYIEKWCKMQIDIYALSLFYHNNAVRKKILYSVHKFLPYPYILRLLATTLFVPIFISYYYHYYYYYFFLLGGGGGENIFYIFFLDTEMGWMVEILPRMMQVPTILCSQ